MKEKTISVKENRPSVVESGASIVATIITGGLVPPVTTTYTATVTTDGKTSQGTGSSEKAAISNAERNAKK